MTTIMLAVNGTLMRGLELNHNMLAAGATFIREAKTAPCYRLWSIDDRHPAMLRTKPGAVIDCELWAVPPDGLATILLGEPAGLCVGKVQLSDGQDVLGVLAEPFLCENRVEITAFGGWRKYMAARARE